MRLAAALVLVALAPLPAQDVWLGDSLARLGFANPLPEKPGEERLVRAKGTPSVVEAARDSDTVLVDGIRVSLNAPLGLRPMRLPTGPAVPRLTVSRGDYDRTLAPLLWSPPPEARRPARILIDPGHGGKDPGKQSKELRMDEKYLTLDTATRLAALLRQAGFEVHLTREKDVFVELEDRAKRAGAVKADLFVSLHYNAAAAASASGIETYCLTPAGQFSTNDPNNRGSTGALPGNRHDALNLRAAYQVQRALVTRLEARDRGVRRARFSMLKDLSCPGILVEGGFMSNRSEMLRLSQESYRQRVAAAIAEGIGAYAGALPR